VLTLNLASVAATSSRAQILCAAPSRQPREHLLLRVKRSLITRNWPEFQIHTPTHIVVVVVVVVAGALPYCLACHIIVCIAVCRRALLARRVHALYAPSSPES
jgi:hypothetical protein